MSEFYDLLGSSYSMVVGINKVWGFLPKTPTKKSTKYLLSDSMTALVGHSQAQKCLQINSKPLYWVMKFLKISFLTDYSTDWLSDYVMPSDKWNSITTKAMGLISSLFNIASSQDVPFCQPLQLQCLHHGSNKAYLCSPLFSIPFLTTA